MCWVELDGDYQDVFDYGQELGGTAPEVITTDGNGHYLSTVIPEIRILSDDNLEEFAYLLDIFWAGWSSIDHHWNEEDYIG